MRTLRPIYDHDSYSKPIEKLLYDYFYALIFAPIFDILRGADTRENAVSSALARALRTGRLTYVAPYFVGKLSAEISKELRRAGAVYMKVKKAYKLEPASLPSDLKMLVMEGNRIQKAKVRRIEDFLHASEGRELPPLSLEEQFGETVSKLDVQFRSSTRPLTGKSMEIPLEPHLKKELEVAYAKNLEIYIADWHKTQILRLRAKVAENVSQGFRASNLVQAILQERDVTQSKAKFLARQETSLMVSKYRQIRYQEVGIDKYVWSTSHDQRVRPDHKELQGKVFSFSNPPVTDQHTMARNNPGEDFNCRCVAIPVVSDSVLLRKGVTQ